jgi:hypothetical protein
LFVFDINKQTFRIPNTNSATLIDSLPKDMKILDSSAITFEGSHLTTLEVFSLEKYLEFEGITYELEKDYSSRLIEIQDVQNIPFFSGQNLCVNWNNSQLVDLKPSVITLLEDFKEHNLATFQLLLALGEDAFRNIEDRFLQAIMHMCRKTEVGEEIFLTRFIELLLNKGVKLDT